MVEGRDDGFLRRLCFDAEAGSLLDGPVRYLLLRDDTLMGMFARLEGAARAEALDALAFSTAAAAAHSFARYRAEREMTDEEFLTQIETMAPELGWGRLRFARTEAGLALTVENSPYVSGIDAVTPGIDQPVCAPIRGIFQAIADSVLGRPARIRETSCAAQGGDSCRFDAA
ncbi:MAG: 4-vinyl reductase [Alphaproteobacteria bacterium]|jgi:predicted hydrocarbon binding protein|nr:4-vinyl reductase [Alphaproteobacteria bacterium]|tara:strand:- start:544 stop:1059 length:516 start_codon:yes stop_codon:yes gene_type:complete